MKPHTDADARTACQSSQATPTGSAATRTATTAASLPTPQQDATPKIVAAVSAFLATLSATEKTTVLFDWTNTAQKQRWSNFPMGGFMRAGLMWGNLSATQQQAWLAMMQATLSDEGYRRVLAEWHADDAVAAQDGPKPSDGRPSASFGRDYYWVAIIGRPSETDPWQWQWGGHHVTVNATVVGPHLSLTPSFIGVQPATYTDASGTTVRPLGDICRRRNASAPPRRSFVRHLNSLLPLATAHAPRVPASATMVL